jgi:CubicO group peptidase (beta-lactamase class C family)
METPALRPSAFEQDCTRRLRQFQREARSPSISAAVVRAGAVTWSDAVGLVDVEQGRVPTLDTQYSIGSITKTFTAVLLLQLRDAGQLDLDERLDRHLPGIAHGDVTLRRMLSHLSGLRREPPAGPGGEIWETLQDPDRDEMLAGVARAGKVSEPGRRWHYSNLAFALLGEVVARGSGRPWEVTVRERLLEPLGMDRTTTEPVEPRACGYFVEPYSDVARLEPLLPLRGMAPAAALWSTPADLPRWAAFLADPDPAVLDPATLAEMRHPQVIADLDAWTLAWGLGLMLYRNRERVAHGHAGGMPGFASSVMAYAKDGQRAGTVVLANSTAGVDVEVLASALLDSARRRPPPVRVDAGRPTPGAGRRSARALVVRGHRVRLLVERRAARGAGSRGTRASRAAARRLRADRSRPVENDRGSRGGRGAARRQGRRRQGPAHVLGDLSLDPHTRGIRHQGLTHHPHAGIAAPGQCPAPSERWSR